MTQNKLTPEQQAEAARLHSDVLALALSDEGLAVSALNPLLARQMSELTLRTRQAIKGDVLPRAVTAAAMEISEDDFKRLVAVRRKYRTLIASGKRQKTIQASSGAPSAPAKPKRRTLTERVKVVRMYPPRY